MSPGFVHLFSRTPLTKGWGIPEVLMKHTCKYFEFGKEGRFCVLPVNTVLLDKLMMTLSLLLSDTISWIWSTNIHFHELTFLLISFAIHRVLSSSYLLLSSLHLARLHISPGYNFWRPSGFTFFPGSVTLDSILLEYDTQLSTVKFSFKYFTHFIPHICMQYPAVGPVQKHQNSVTGHKNIKEVRAVATCSCCSVRCACRTEQQRLTGSLPLGGFILSLQLHTPAVH